MTAPPDNCSPVNYPEGNCLRGKLPPDNKISLEHSPPPTQANSPQRVLKANWGKLCIVYEYYNIQVLQLRSKRWFTSIYILQILMKPCRALLIRENFSLNASWFSYARTQERKKKQFSGKIYWEKNTKKSSW